MTKKFIVPFAEQGDREAIPDTVQSDGKVSYSQGFGYDYERDYNDPASKDIKREVMNGIFRDITSAIGELQLQGASEHSTALTYPKGAIVYFRDDLYISDIAANKDTPPKNWTSIKNIASDSLKKAMNLSDLTDKAKARSNLGLGNSATLNKTSALSDSENLVATPKMVNSVNLTAVNAQNTANTAVANAKTAQTRADAAFSKVKPISEGGTGATTAEGARENLGIGNIVNETGSSTTDIMSQKAVTDQLNAIESGHGLGYGQSWANVTSQRVSGTTYTNNTGKPIMINVSVPSTQFNDNEAVKVYVDDLFVMQVGSNASWAQPKTGSVVVPVGSTYRYNILTASLLQKYYTIVELR